MSIPSVMWGFCGVMPSGPLTGKLRVFFDPKVFVAPFQMAAEMTALSPVELSVAEPMKAIWFVPGRGSSRIQRNVLPRSSEFVPCWPLSSGVNVQVRAPGSAVVGPDEDRVVRVGARHHEQLAAQLLVGRVEVTHGHGRRPRWRRTVWASLKGAPMPLSQFVPSTATRAASRRPAATVVLRRHDGAPRAVRAESGPPWRTAAQPS